MNYRYDKILFTKNAHDGRAQTAADGPAGFAVEDRLYGKNEALFIVKANRTRGQAKPLSFGTRQG